MKILIIAPAWVGDTVMAQPLFTLLHRRYSDSGSLQLDVLAPPFTLPLLTRMPEVHRAIPARLGHGELKPGERLRLARELRATRYDQAIVLPNSFKSALIPFFARIPLRTGYRGEMRYGLLNDLRRLDEQALPRMVQRFAALALESGKPLPAELPRPRLRTRPRRATELAQTLALDIARPVAVLCPGAEYGPAKRWPVEHFAALARALWERGYAVWLIGSPKDAESGTAIAAASDGAAVNLCGRTTLEDAIDLIAKAALVITNDSGLMHVAAALDRPTLALYGSSSPQFTPPLSEQAKILRIDIECSPCFERVCPLGHFNCMRQLLPQQVLDAIPSPNPLS